MSVAVDPLASLRSWDLMVELGDREYLIAARNAADWLPILLDDPFDASAVLPGMLSDSDAELLEEDLIDGGVTAQEVIDAALEVISLASGRSWWWTMRLLSYASASWLVLWGDLIARGIDVQRLPLGSVLDALYLTLASRLKEEMRKSLDRELETPPAGHAPALDEDKEAASFLALMNSA